MQFCPVTWYSTATARLQTSTAVLCSRSALYWKVSQGYSDRHDSSWHMQLSTDELQTLMWPLLNETINKLTNWLEIPWACLSFSPYLPTTTFGVWTLYNLITNLHEFVLQNKGLTQNFNKELRQVFPLCLPKVCSFCSVGFFSFQRVVSVK